MPELPDVTVYIEALEQRISGRTLTQAQIASVFLVRTIEPPVDACVGHKVTGLRRLGKRIAFGFDVGLGRDIWLVLHLMIAGRLHWRDLSQGSPKKADGRRTLASFVFDSGCLTLTEAGSLKRASLHMAAGEAGLAALDPGGIDVMTAPLDLFSRALVSGNHTLKRALTDPRVFSGIGNAYSDEILHRARLSPIKLTSKLTAEEIATLHAATQGVLQEWVERLRAEAAGKFPEKVTAFREGMAVHGRHRQPCPRCGAKIQRIRYASNETNYCAVCQTGGRLLADRALSRLLGQDWPRTLEELEISS
jgi:formamidopyrimidine-DNA glycosylase